MPYKFMLSYYRPYENDNMYLISYHKSITESIEAANVYKSNKIRAYKPIMWTVQEIQTSFDNGAKYIKLTEQYKEEEHILLSRHHLLS